MHAARVNLIDFKIRNGDLCLLIKGDFPLVLGSDGAGVVKNVVRQVTKFKPGGQVYFRNPKNHNGTFPPGEFIEKLSAIIPPPKLRAFGILPSFSLLKAQDWRTYFCSRRCGLN